MKKNSGFLKFIRWENKHVRAVIFVAAFALIGGTIIIYTRAATPTASFEAENGAVSLAASTGNDALASNGRYVQFGSGQTGGGSLPAGVTLQDIDGGKDYFSQWSNTFPSAQADPNFFMFGMFNEYDIGATSFLTPSGQQQVKDVNGNTVSKAVAWKGMGINTFVNLYNGFLSGNPTEISVAKNLGMYAIGGPESTASALNSYGSTAAGYVYQDEAENNTCSKVDVSWLKVAPYCTNSNGKTTTASFPRMTNAMHQFDPTRPVYNGFTNGYVFDWFLSGTSAELAQGSDIIGYDVYPLTDRRSDFNGALSVGKVWGVYQTVKLSREHTKVNGVYTKPVWPVNELAEGDTYDTTCYRPTGADIKAEVWQAIVAGARGVTFFDANFASNCGGTIDHAVSLYTPYAPARAAITAVTAEVRAVAPVINSPFANGYETHTGTGINTMVKYYNGKFYIFATPKASGNQSVTFTLAGAPSGTVTELNENRSINLSNGAFSDTFAGETSYHVYRVN